VKIANQNVSSLATYRNDPRFEHSNYPIPNRSPRTIEIGASTKQLTGIERSPAKTLMKLERQIAATPAQAKVRFSSNGLT
jgi:hypothetical protein